MDGINLPKCKPSPTENEVYLFCYRIVHSANSLSHVPSSCKANSSGSSSPTTTTHAIFFITFISLFKTLLVTFAEFFFITFFIPISNKWRGWVILFSSILLIVLFSQYVLHFSFFFICCTCSSSLLQPSSVSKFPRSARSSFFFFYLRWTVLTELFFWPNRKNHKLKNRFKKRSSLGLFVALVGWLGFRFKTGRNWLLSTPNLIL